jgi:hypothetical protein
MSTENIKKVLLATYKKANKVRRASMCAKYGYATEEAFLNYLTDAGGKLGSKQEETPNDVVVAFDTTGSMYSYIQAVKEHAKQLISDLFKNTPNLRVKVVAFGDYCDMQASVTSTHADAVKFGKAYQVIELTNDENALIKFIDGAQRTSGGDVEEFYELVIQKINDETKWRNGNRTVVLIADHGPHPVGYSFTNVVKNAQIDWREEAKKAAEMGIKYDTLMILKDQAWYQELSKITGGVALPFVSSNKMSQTIEAITYSRGSKEMFKSKMLSAEKSGDAELIGVYKCLSTEL